MPLRGLIPALNLSDLLNAATARGNLGGTTIGQSLFTLTNPSAITFPRLNADNSVTALTAANFNTALGLGTGDTPTFAGVISPTYTSSGAMGFTPASGSGFNITLAGTGDFAVGTDLCVDTSASKTGIGTNAPAERLHVLGTGTTYQRFETSGAATPAGSYGLTPTTELDSTSFGGYNITRFGVSTVGYNGLIGVAGGLLLGTYGNTDLVIGTNNTERIRVKNNGYAGSGTSAPVTIWNVEGASVSPASLTLSNLYTSSPFAVTQSTTHYGVYMGADASSGNAWIQVDNAGTAYALLLQLLGGNIGMGGVTAPTALAHIGASTTSRASLCLEHGAAPTSPVNGDMWTTTAGLFVRINGATVGPLS